MIAIRGNDDQPRRPRAAQIRVVTTDIAQLEARAEKCLLNLSASDASDQ